MGSEEVEEAMGRTVAFEAAEAANAACMQEAAMIPLRIGRGGEGDRRICRRTCCRTFPRGSGLACRRGGGASRTCPGADRNSLRRSGDLCARAGGPGHSSLRDSSAAGHGGGGAGPADGRD